MSAARSVSSGDPPPRRQAAAALATPGSSWWEYALPVGVAALAGLAAPLTRARGLRRAVDTLPATIAAQKPAHAPAEAYEDGYRSGLARLWAASPATGTGRAEDDALAVLLEAIRRQWPGAETIPEANDWLLPDRGAAVELLDAAAALADARGL